MDLPSPRSFLHSRLSGAIPRCLHALRACRFPCVDVEDAVTQLLQLLRHEPDSLFDFSAAGGPATVSATLLCALKFGAEGLRTADLAGELLTVHGQGLPAGWTATTPTPMPAPRAFSFASFSACPAFDAPQLLPGGVDAAAAAAAAAAAPPLPCIALRLVTPAHRRQAAQEDVGFALWPASLPFSRWLVAHRGALFPRPGMAVLELGAGCGLCGLAAGLAAAPTGATVTLSDFNPTVLANLHANACLNEPGLHKGGEEEEACGAWEGQQLAALAAAAPAGGIFRLAHLDWDAEGVEGGLGAQGAEGEQQQQQPSGAVLLQATSHPPPPLPLPPSAPPFDLILGCDIVVSREDAAAVARVCRQRLARCGLAILCVPPDSVRWGVGALEPALAANSLSFQVLPMQQCLLGAVYVGEEGQGGEEGLAARRQGLELAEEATVACGYEDRLRLYLIRHSAS